MNGSLLRSEHFNPLYLRLLRILSLAIGAFLVGIGCMVLAGWMFEVPLLKRVLQADRVTMNPMTAVKFALCGVSLLLLQGHQHTRRMAGIVVAGVVIVLALLKIAAYESWLSWSVDSLLFEYRLAGSLMATHTALTPRRTRPGVDGYHYLGPLPARPHLRHRRQASSPSSPSATTSTISCC